MYVQQVFFLLENTNVCGGKNNKTKVVYHIDYFCSAPTVLLRVLGISFNEVLGILTLVSHGAYALETR